MGEPLYKKDQYFTNVLLSYVQDTPRVSQRVLVREWGFDVVC